MKRHSLLVMLLVLGVALLGINNAFATTANQQASANFATNNSSNVNEINIQNTTKIQNTTADNGTAVNNTVKNLVSTMNNTGSTTDSGNNSEGSNSSVASQNKTEAAGDENYSNVHGIWLSTDDVNKVTLDELKNAGITDIFVKANRISIPTYQSVLKTILNKVEGSGIRVHAWITCFVSSNGTWIDPQSTKGQNVMDQIITEVTDITTNYNIDGIHLDYVRYPGTAYKHQGGTDTITAFVQRVYGTVKSIKPNVAVSAALMPEGSVNAYYYGQNYTALSQYLDFLVPMVYMGNYKENMTWIGKTTAYIVNHANGKPVVAGLQTYGSDSNLTVLPASEIMEEIETAEANGSSGYALFRYGWLDKAFFTASNLTNSSSTGTSINGTSSATNTSSTNGTTSTNATVSNGTSTGSSSLNSTGSSSGSVSFSVAQLCDAASRVKAYVESYKVLPNYVTIGSCQVGMPEFLRLLTVGLVQVNGGSSASVCLKDEGAALNPVDSVKSGNVYKSEYLSLARSTVSFMDSHKVAPNYGSVSLGKIQYQSLVYMYSRIMSFYGVNKVLPNYAAIKPWTQYTKTTSTSTSGTSGSTGTGSSTSTGTSTSSSGSVSFSVAQLCDAASRVKAYVESYKVLPNYVTIGSCQVGMPEFLRLLTVGLVQVNGGSSASVCLKDEGAALNPVDSVKSGNVYKSEYLSLARSTVSFMDSHKVAPNYGSVSLGKIQYQSLVYMYSRIMSFYGVNKVLPNYAAIKPWTQYTKTTTTTIPAALQKYLKATANCQSSNAKITALASSLTSGSSSTYEKAEAIFNWVRDNISYSFYDNTKYGAVGTLNAKTGNCCDHTHLLIALARAAGIPARYEHGYCKFSSGNWYGHVWAQLYINGKWYMADAISSRNSLGVINNWNTNSWTLKGIYTELPF